MSGYYNDRRLRPRLATRDAAERDATGKYAETFSDVDRSCAWCAYRRRLRSFTKDSLQSLTYLAPGPRWALPLYTPVHRPFDLVWRNTGGGMAAAPKEKMRVREREREGGGRESERASGRKRKVAEAQAERTKRSFVGALHTAELY